MVSKHSLDVLDGHEDLQAIVTRNATQFAELTLMEARKNSLSRKEVIKEVHTEPAKTGGTVFVQTRYSR